jgi:SAM-dependent methyltransferase
MNRVQLINKFINERGFSRYLELGVYDKSTFNQITASNKTSVDLIFDADYRMSTEDFFSINSEKFDLIFIDANHCEKYVTHDIKECLNILNKNGVIICHDVNPPDEYSQIDSNNLYQSAWKAFVKFRLRSDILTYSYSTDCGLGVIDTQFKRDQFQEFILSDKELEEIDYSFLENNRSRLLKQIDV